ncbi:hypothetical protein [Paraliomyxa miuraensis]|uniref:hypothetical protein n=1 Tax=Paraliomyxa miuraensis TaxID=376150 RepID=UPI002259E699|nr:hypothetical protein [Paraliomyxa miuraensis]MCX4246003.1 hypothetical protein [Paraliomyxa miuraensis]
MQVNGTVLRSRTLFVRSKGDDAWQRVLHELQPATREAAEAGFLETRWYPFDLLIDISSTADRMLGEGDMALCREMGRHSCGITLTTIHRLLLKFGNIGHLVDRAATAWRTQFDTGEIVVHERSNDLYVFELRRIPTPHRAHCSAITGWMERAAELSGEDEFELEEKCRALGHGYCMWTFKRRPMGLEI